MPKVACTDDGGGTFDAGTFDAGEPDAGPSDAGDPDTGLGDGGDAADASTAVEDGGSNAAVCLAVSGLRTTSTDTTHVALEWTGSSGVSVRVARKTFCGSVGYQTLASLPAGANSYSVNTVQAFWVYW